MGAIFSIFLFLFFSIFSLLFWIETTLENTVNGQFMAQLGTHSIYYFELHTWNAKKSYTNLFFCDCFVNLFFFFVIGVGVSNFLHCFFLCSVVRFLFLFWIWTFKCFLFTFSMSTDLPPNVLSKLTLQLRSVVTCISRSYACVRFVPFKIFIYSHSYARCICAIFTVQLFTHTDTWYAY